MAASEVDALIGQVLSGRFEIIEAIGTGGMGRVYKAVQRPLGREVALKVLNPKYDGTRDPGFERRFFLEASMTAKLKHPNTITVHDYGRTDDGIYFIAMELLEGETLQKVIVQHGRMPWARAIFIGAQVARSLREAHKLGLVHRDLKPANVMVLHEGADGDTVKVLDFGLVKSFAPDGEAVDETGITQAGILLGSPLYMAPEQARGEADPRTDIYALGVLLFQCITGKPPFSAKVSLDLLIKHAREKPPELTALVPDVPPEVNALVMKCLEKDPNERFQTMDALLDAMRIASSGQGVSGIFADPRTQSGLIRATTQAGGAATPNPLTAEEVRSIEVEIADADRPRRLPLVLGVAGVVLLGASVGGVAAWRALRTEAVTPPPKSEPVTPPKVEATAVDVRFYVDSEPQGATVLRDGVKLGVTPFSLTLQRTTPEPLQLELAYQLEGYEPLTVTAKGLDGAVSISPPLKKKPDEPVTRTPTSKTKPKNPKTTKQPSDPEGFKDDPY